MRKFFVVLLSFLLFSVAYGQQKKAALTYLPDYSDTVIVWKAVQPAGRPVTLDALKHEVRFGVGDMLFEMIVWHDHVQKTYDGAGNATYKDCHRYTPHFSMEYSYHCLPWLSVGLNLNFQHTSWADVTYDGNRKFVSSVPQDFYNLCIMPVARFNYFRREHVGFYSEIAAGLDINGGTEVDYNNRNTEVGAGMDLRFFGVTAGYGHWWGFFDIGLLCGLKNKNQMFLMGSQLMRVGLSYRF